MALDVSSTVVGGKALNHFIVSVSLCQSHIWLTKDNWYFSTSCNILTIPFCVLCFTCLQWSMKYWDWQPSMGGMVCRVTGMMWKIVYGIVLCRKFDF